MVFIGLGTSQLEGHFISEHRAVSNANIGKRPSVSKYGGAFKSLHQIGLDCVAHERSKGATGSDIVAGHRVTTPSAGNDHSAETIPHVRKTCAERENRHALTG